MVPISLNAVKSVGDNILTYFLINVQDSLLPPYGIKNNFFHLFTSSTLRSNPDAE
jgi:hypothetical protein